jgi:FKBP-type peptidyl-prolyl cis-trans isomerase
VKVARRSSAYVPTLAIVFAALTAGCGSAPPAPATAPPMAATAVAPTVAATALTTAPQVATAPPAAQAAAPPTPPPTVAVVDSVVGTGDAAAAGDHVTVHYVGTLPGGAEFDSSRKRHRPFDFVLGRGQVIKGWEDGIVGMKVGGHRKLTIPSALGYGERGQPPVIPPNATLLFDVELLAIEHASPAAASRTETITARHVLIEYMGARGAEASIVRTRDQARAVAAEVLERAKAGEDFARLALEYSDEAGAGPRGGALGRFGRGKMVPEFDAAAFALKPGEVSSVVETPFGFHVIQRLE